jgi:Fur family zinc uptake transcriptional regulator
MDAHGFATHDHSACRSGALKAAEAHCAEHGLRLTPLRRRVLEMLLESHKALGAYDMLDRLRAEGLGSQPPVVYRALDFLTEHGFAHRLERLNAFTACAHPEADAHRPAFLICRVCKSVAEVAAKRHAALMGLAQDTGFVVERIVLEAEGVCPNCQGADA